jgi:hypothetical protein
MSSPDRSSWRVGRQRRGSGSAGEQHLHHAQDLRHHDRRTDALDEPEGDEDDDVRRESAHQRRTGEDGHADHIHPPPPVQVTETGARDQEHRVRAHIAADHKLQRRTRTVQVGSDGGHRDVDHEHVQQGHELTDEQHGQRQPRAPASLARPLDGAVPPSNGAHGVVSDHVAERCVGGMYSPPCPDSSLRPQATT